MKSTRTWSTVLISRLHPAKPQRIDGKGGDRGRDVQITDEHGSSIAEVFQLKSFTGRMGPTQRKQVARSLKRVATLVTSAVGAGGAYRSYSRRKTNGSVISERTTASRPDGLEKHGWTRRCRRSQTFAVTSWRGQKMRCSACLEKFGNRTFPPESLKFMMRWNGYAGSASV